MLLIAGFGMCLARKDALSVGAQYDYTAIRSDTVLDSHRTQCLGLR